MARQMPNLDDQRPPELTLVRVARAGDVEAVASIIEAAAPSTHHNLDSSDPHFIFPSVLNEAKVWDDIVERDYENVYSWYEVRRDMMHAHHLLCETELMLEVLDVFQSARTFIISRLNP